MTSTRWFERPGEPRLSYRIDVPEGPSLGRVLLIHGYADHSSRFDRIAAIWQASGLTVARFDLRGHGLSEGARGHVARFSDYVRDVRELLKHLQESSDWNGERPPSLFGHSLGGLIASQAALALGPGVSGLALTSPFFAVAKPPPALLRALAPLIMRLLPGLKQPSGLSGSDMTHDADIVKGYDADPLRFSYVTVGWFGEVLRAQADVMERARLLTTPCFCIAAGDDRVVAVAVTRRFFDLLGSAEKELDVRPGLFHEVLNELDYRDHARRLGEHMLRWMAA